MIAVRLREVFPVRRCDWILALLAVLAPACLPVAAAKADADPRAERIARYLNSQRERQGAEPLERRPVLDEVARQRARRVAGLVHSERLALGESIEERLRDSGIEAFRRASVHTDMVRGYRDPVAGFLKSWKNYQAAWSKAIDPRYDGVGLATVQADDGWIILIAVFVDDLPTHDNLFELERRTIEAVNAIRVARGLVAMDERGDLAAVARAHSEEMAGRDYFRHISPDGRRTEDRVLAAGIAYIRLAENLQKNRGWDDPVDRAVRSWMESDGHREAILDPLFRQTGVGIAVTADGTLYFTQLFLLPREPRGEPAAPGEADEGGDR